MKTQQTGVARFPLQGDCTTTHSMYTHNHADTHAGPPTYTCSRTCMLQSAGQALTCLEMMSFPSGMGAPFSVAILFKVAMAFSWFPESTSYLALSGSHCGYKGPGMAS